MTQLMKLVLTGNPIERGCRWELLPQQVLHLSLFHCGLQQLPAELAGRQGLSVYGCGT